MEFVIGGLAAASAGVLTNPIDVLKHEMELNRKSPVNEQYRNFIQASCDITKKKGFKSLQNGLSPAICAHLTSYGMKLGTYEFARRRGLTTNSEGEIEIPLSLVMSAAGGIFGQYLSSPFYLIKVYMELEKQEQKSDKNNFSQTVAKIYKDHGTRGFFKGATASLPRAFIGTSQLTSFAIAKEKFNKMDFLKEMPLLTNLLASIIAGLVLSLAMTPFDMILTKLYKQALNPHKSRIYNGLLDCVKKTYKKDGFKPFYRSIGPVYVRLGPHTILCLLFWEQLKDVLDSSLQTHNKNNRGLNSMSNDHFGGIVFQEVSPDLYW